MAWRTSAVQQVPTDRVLVRRMGVSMVPEFLDLHEAGALAEAVEHMNGRDGLLAIEIAAMREHGRHARADLASTSVRWPTRTPGTSAMLLQRARGQAAAGKADVPGAGRAIHQGHSAFTKAAISA